MKKSCNSSLKIMAIIAIICSNSFNTFSQENRLELVLNVMNTNFNYGNENENMKDYKTAINGLQFGASYQYSLSESFSVVPAFYFIMKGAGLKEKNPINNQESKIRLYNLEFPLLLRQRFGQLYINAGPYISYSLAGRQKFIKTDNSPEKTTDIAFGNGVNEFKRWEAGIQAGAAYNIKTEKRNFLVGLTYNYGLSNISNTLERYNRGFYLTLNISKRK